MDLRCLDRRTGEIRAVRREQDDLVGETQVLQIPPNRRRAEPGVPRELGVVQQSRGPKHGETLELAEGKEVGNPSEIGQIALQEGLLVGAQPLAPFLVIERQELRHPAPGGKVVERLRPRGRLLSEQPRRRRAQHLGEVLRSGDETVEQGLRRRRSRRRADLGEREGPQLVHEGAPRQRLAHLAEQQHAGRTEQHREAHVVLVVGVLHLVEDPRLLLRLVDQRRPDCPAPGGGLQAPDGLPLLDGVEVDVAEIRVQLTREGCLPRLARPGDDDQSPPVARRRPGA